MLRNLGTLVLLLLLATPLVTVAQSTGKIAGRVVDDLGDPLPGANVVIEGTQLGAATDIDGNYFIIGIPVGDYTVRASFVGYQPQSVSGVQVSSGYTTQQDFELGSEIGLEEIVVEYERPIIQRDAVGVPKVVTAEQIENLPVRGVASVAAIQSGVVSNSGDDDLFARGGREQEVVYFVDGVKVTGDASVAVNQQAIQEQEILIGTIPARYGDALSGVISITTKSGAEKFFGSVEAITSEVLDSYGYNLGSISVGGPIVPGRASFFLSASGQLEADNSPFGADVLALTDDSRRLLDEQPLGFQVVDGAGNVSFVPADLSALDGASFEDIAANPGAFGITLPEGSSIGSPVLQNVANTFGPEAFTTETGKDHAYEELTFNGNVTVNPLNTVSLRAGGVFETSREEVYSGRNALFNPANQRVDDRQTWRAFLTLRQRLSNNAFYQIQGEFQNWQQTLHPERFSDDVSDVLFYGDVDDARNAAAARYLAYDQDSGTYVQQATDGDLNVGGAYGLFRGAGYLADGFAGLYQKEDQSTLRFSGSATTQLGVHQIEFGAEFEQQTRRFFQIFGEELATLFEDETVEGGVTDRVSSYGDLTYEQLISNGGGVPTYRYYGYSFNGINEVDDQDIDAFGRRENLNVAPHKPIYYAGYIQDKIEYRDLVINLGLRVDVFDNNTLVLRDPFAPYPIVRAGNLTEAGEFFVDGFTLPNGIDGDYAAYFSNTNDVSTIVGFRDADGNFYDLDGNEADRVDIDNAGSIRTLSGSRAVTSAMFEDYTPEVTFMPRVGVSFPVTDRALFFASYNVTSQRPTEAAFYPFSTFDNISSGTTYQNPNLKPERTTQYELGFRQRVGERAALTLSGFYRTQENKIGVRDLGQFGAGDVNSYNSYLNVDQSTAKGVELGFDLRRTNNLSINANYTLSFAEGTGSDATTASAIAWQSREYPQVVLPTDFDRRHSANISLDYRLGEDEGPMVGGARIFENFGINILGNFRSGLPYTRVTINDRTLDITESIAPSPRGAINSARLPSSTQIDLKVDRRFDLGFGAVKAYVWVQNLLGTDAPLTVYRTNGIANNSGLTPTSVGAFPDAYDYQYQQFEAAPEYLGNNSYTSNGGGGILYNPPRRIRLGVLLNF